MVPVTTFFDLVVPPTVKPPIQLDFHSVDTMDAELIKMLMHL